MGIAHRSSLDSTGNSSTARQLVERSVSFHVLLAMPSERFCPARGSSISIPDRRLGPHIPFE